MFTFLVPPFLIVICVEGFDPEIFGGSFGQSVVPDFPHQLMGDEHPNDNANVEDCEAQANQKDWIAVPNEHVVLLPVH